MIYFANRTRNKMKARKNRRQTLGITVASAESEGFSAFVGRLEIRPDVFVTSGVGTTAIWRDRGSFSETETFRRIKGHLDGMDPSRYSWELLDAHGSELDSCGDYQQGWSSRISYMNEDNVVGPFWGPVTGDAA